MNIHIDRDMILTELYSIRANITEAALNDDEVKEGKMKLDNLINIISTAPSAENNANFPKTRVRR